jgi:hypothetical protein
LVFLIEKPASVEAIMPVLPGLSIGNSGEGVKQMGIIADIGLDRSVFLTTTPAKRRTNGDKKTGFNRLPRMSEFSLGF